MDVLVIDSNVRDLNLLVAEIKKTTPQAPVFGTISYSDAREYIHSKKINYLFVNVDCNISSIGLINELRIKYPYSIIIGISESDMLAADAFRMRLSGFLVKPLTEKMIKDEYEYHLRLCNLEKCETPIKIMTFGNFECFVNGVPAVFKYQKSKEMLAYLIDKKGAMVSDGELNEILLAEVGNKISYLKNLKCDLLRVFCEAGMEEAVIRRRGLIGINTRFVKCDYYDIIDKGYKLLGRYWGEYMSQYKWGDSTRRYLENLYKAEIGGYNVEP